MSYWDLMGLPIKTFWMLSQNIERILAQQDMRNLTVAVCGQQAGETAQNHRSSLMEEIGVVVKLEVNPLAAVRDEAGFATLKEMALAM